MLLLKWVTTGRRSQRDASYQYPARGWVDARPNSPGIYFWAWDPDAVSLLELVPPRGGLWLVGEAPTSTIAVGWNCARTSHPCRDKRCCPEVRVPRANIVYDGDWDGALACIAANQSDVRPIPSCPFPECLVCGEQYVGNTEARLAAIQRGEKVHLHEFVDGYMRKLPGEPWRHGHGHAMLGFTLAERRRCQVAADAAGLSLSTWIKRAALRELEGRTP